MDEQTMNQKDSVIVGATYEPVDDTAPTDSNSEETKVESLPMELYLMGNEAICEQFSVDADTAMSKLGIKRSRLTQISGKELRVARMRIGRYIRPIYRPEDIETYLEWSRTPVSHKKSTDLIEAASKDLQNQAELVGKNISLNIDASLASLKSQIENYEKKLHGFSEQLICQSDLISENIAKNNAEQLQAVSGELEGFRSRLVELEASIQEVANLKTGIQDLRDSIIDLRNASLSRAKEELELTNSFRQKLTDLETSHNELKVSDLKNRLQTEQLGEKLLEALSENHKQSTKRSLLLRSTRLGGSKVKSLY